MSRQPTPQEAKQITDYINEYYNNNYSIVEHTLVNYLRERPTIFLDSIRDERGRTPYMLVMNDSYFYLYHPLFYETIMRNPNPFLKDKNGLTVREHLEKQVENYAQIPNVLDKLMAKLQFAKIYETEYLARHGANVASARVAFPNGIPLPGAAESLVSEYLSGESGPLPVAMSKLRVKSGKSGVAPRGGRKTQRKLKRRRTTRRR